MAGRVGVLNVLAVLVLLGGAAGCGQDAGKGGAAAGAGQTSAAASASASAGASAGAGAGAVPTSAAASASASAAASAGAGAKAVCTAVAGDLTTSLAKVAEAEKIGPPAGHHAVSAAWSAGAAVIYSRTIGADGAVAKAATDLADAMTAIAGKYVDAKSKPDKAPVNAAAAAFRAACA